MANNPVISFIKELNNSFAPNFKILAVAAYTLSCIFLCYQYPTVGMVALMFIAIPTSIFASVIILTVWDFFINLWWWIH